MAQITRATKIAAVVDHLRGLWMEEGETTAEFVQARNDQPGFYWEYSTGRRERIELTSREITKVVAALDGVPHD